MHLPIAVLKVLKSTYPDTYQFVLNHLAPHRETAVLKRVPLDRISDIHLDLIKDLCYERANHMKLRKVYRGKRDPRGYYCVKSDAVHYTVYPA